LDISITVKATCTEGNIRLGGGDYYFEGRVEVCHNNEWGAVCDDGWGRSDGIVACHQLGLEFASVTTQSSFGVGTARIWLDNLSCTGSENRLIDCAHNRFDVHDCGVLEHAGVVCEGMYCR